MNVDKWKKYPYLAYTRTKNVKPPDIDVEIFGHHYSEVKTPDVRTWGFETEENRDKFLVKYGDYR